MYSPEKKPATIIDTKFDGITELVSYLRRAGYLNENRQIYTKLSWPCAYRYFVPPLTRYEDDEDEDEEASLARLLEEALDHAGLFYVAESTYTYQHPRDFWITFRLRPKGIQEV